MFDTDTTKAVERLATARDRILVEVRKCAINQDEVVEEILIALFARGHCLLDCKPGVAKALLLTTLCRTLSLSCMRIQQTLDLLPSDVTGTAKHRGPLFGNFILADDINYAPLNTQAVLFDVINK